MRVKHNLLENLVLFAQLAASSTASAVGTLFEDVAERSGGEGHPSDHPHHRAVAADALGEGEARPVAY